MDASKRYGTRRAMSKKILYLRTDITLQELQVGGSVAHTIGVVRGFVDTGYAVVCASSAMIPVLKMMPLLELRVLDYPLWLKVIRWRFNCLLSNIFFTYQALSLFKSHQFLFIYQRYSLLNVTGVLLSKIKKIFLILEYNGSEIWANSNWGKKGLPGIHAIELFIENVNLKAAHLIVVVSQVLKEELIKRGISAQKILVNPNGVDTELYNAEGLLDERERIRTEHFLRDKFVFGFIGTFCQWHGIEVLAAMIPAIVKQRSKSHFLLVGQGPLLPYVQSVLDKHQIGPQHVTLIGLVPQHQARNYLAACDAFLCPTQPNADGSRFFGSPTKLFEYMSLGKPVIASELEQIAEVVSPATRISEQPEKTSLGFLINPLMINDFVSAAIRLVDLNSLMLKNMGLNARAKAVNCYTWISHVQNITRACGY